MGSPAGDVLITKNKSKKTFPLSASVIRDHFVTEGVRVACTGCSLENCTVSKPIVVSECSNFALVYRHFHVTLQSGLSNVKTPCRLLVVQRKHRSLLVVIAFLN